MIRASIILFFCVSILYEIFEHTIKPHWWKASQSTFQANIIKSQDFLYNDSLGIETLIVGSSLAARIVTDSLSNAYNLALSGQSVFDGLEIIKKSGKAPKVILVETNMMFKSLNMDFISNLFSPLPCISKKCIHALREDQQPLAILGNELSWRVVAPLIKLFENSQINYASSGIPDKENLASMFPIQEAIFSKMPGPLHYDTLYSILGNRLKELHKRGSKIVLFEMPINYKLQILPLQKERLAAFGRVLKNEINYCWLAPDTSVYTSTDGIHLDPEEAKKFNMSLRLHVDQLTRSGGAELAGELVLPPAASGVVLFAHGSGSADRAEHGHEVRSQHSTNRDHPIFSRRFWLYAGLAAHDRCQYAHCNSPAGVGQ